MNKFLFSLLFYSCTISAFATSGYWTGGSDGVTWADNDNWSTAVYPNLTNCLVIFDGDGNHVSANPSLTAAGTAPICIDLGGATININYIVIRDGANVTFKNGILTTVGNNTSGSGLIIQGMSCLTLGEPTVSFTFNSVGRVLITQTSKLDVDCMANLNISFPASADPAALLEGILLEGPNPKSTLDNCGNIVVGSGFLNGIKAEGCLNNKPTGKIEIKSGTYPGRKSCGLCVGSFSATGGSLNNEGSILVGIGFRIGTSISPGGTFNNIGECSLLSTTSGADGNGLVINGTSDYGEFTNEGLFITDNNGPICENAGTTPDAEFIICTDASDQNATYTTTIGGVATSATMELNEVVLENFGATALSKTTYCKTIVVPNPTENVTLDVQSIGSCASLTCATSVVEKTVVEDLKVIKIVEDFTKALDCGESIDTFCVFLGQPNGGNYSYYNTETEALSGVGTALGNPFQNIKEDKEVWVRYAITGPCVATEKINITITHPTFTLTTKDLEICEGASVDLSSGFISFDKGTSKGTTSFNYYNSLADAQNAVNQLTSTIVSAQGTYYIRYDVDTDFDDTCEGCAVIEPITVIFKTKPTATVSGGGIACTGEDLPNVSIALTGTGPWDITYTDGTTPTTVTGITTSPYIINGASAGNYSVSSVTDANSCSNSGTSSAIVNVTDCSIDPSYTFTINDPCNCQNPANITLADGRILFADILTVTPAIYDPAAVVTVTGDDNFLDANGLAIPITILTDNRNGVYTLVFYTLQEAPAMIKIDIDGEENNFTTSSCTPCNIVASIPTMNQWGLFIFGLLLMNFSISFLYWQEALTTKSS